VIWSQDSMRRRLTALLAACVIVLGLVFFASPPAALASGCGTSDHTVGQFPGWEIHYYEGHWNSGNSHFHKWWHVTIGGAYYVDTFCGCINPNLPCYHGPEQQ
jgi:hypothetical protein